MENYISFIVTSQNAETNQCSAYTWARRMELQFSSIIIRICKTLTYSFISFPGLFKQKLFEKSSKMMNQKTRLVFHKQLLLCANNSVTTTAANKIHVDWLSVTVSAKNP